MYMSMCVYIYIYIYIYIRHARTAARWLALRARERIPRLASRVDWR